MALRAQPQSQPPQQQQQQEQDKRSRQPSAGHDDDNPMVLVLLRQLNKVTSEKSALQAENELLKRENTQLQALLQFVN